MRIETLESRKLLAASVGWDGPGLGSAELTYHIANSPPSLSQAQTDAAIEQAFEYWAEHADIQFTPTTSPGQADSIDIAFAQIDGPNQTLGRAFLPDDVNSARLAGDITFDSAENWEIGNQQGSRAFDLMWVAVHEIGHALGLEHIDDHGHEQDSVLADSVSPNSEFTGLSSADIDAILRLYAPARQELPNVEPLPPDSVGPDHLPQSISPKSTLTETVLPDETVPDREPTFRRWRFRSFDHDNVGDTSTPGLTLFRVRPFRNIAPFRFVAPDQLHFRLRLSYEAVPTDEASVDDLAEEAKAGHVVRRLRLRFLIR